MKKVFAIMVILVVLVGMVFATQNQMNGSSNITVKTKVARSIPTFNLRGLLGDTAPTAQNATAVSATLTYNSQATTGFNASATAVLDAESIDISVDDITAAFSIFQNNNANVHCTYSVNYSVGKLTRILSSTTENVTTYSAATGDSAYVINSTGTIGTAETDAVIVSKITKDATTDENEAKLTITEVANAGDHSQGGLSLAYTGKVDAATTNLRVGTFVVKWKHDVEAIDGDYRADVILTVSGS